MIRSQDYSRWKTLWNTGNWSSVDSRRYFHFYFSSSFRSPFSKVAGQSISLLMPKASFITWCQALGIHTFLRINTTAFVNASNLALIYKTHQKRVSCLRCRSLLLVPQMWQTVASFPAKDGGLKNAWSLKQKTFGWANLSCVGQPIWNLWAIYGQCALPTWHLASYVNETWLKQSRGRGGVQCWERAWTFWGWIVS